MVNRKVLVFGEILFDIIEGKEFIGGAPFNFAYYLKTLGIDVIFVSAVGNDKRGEKAIEVAKKIGIDTSFINIVNIPTGIVDVYIEDGKPSFNIKYPAAWDYIKISSEMAERIKGENPEYFYFGSLSLRSETSYNTFNFLSSIMNKTVKFCDINLRKPFYNKEILSLLLKRADILKLNDEEIEEISEILKIKGDMETKMIKIGEKFGIRYICTTMGEKGAYLLSNRKFYFSPAEKIKVVDTVGAGDAFAAGLMKGFMDNLSPEEILSLANHLGGKASSTRGAIPSF